MRNHLMKGDLAMRINMTKSEYIDSMKQLSKIVDCSGVMCSADCSFAFESAEIKGVYGCLFIRPDMLEKNGWKFIETIQTAFGTAEVIYNEPEPEYYECIGIDYTVDKHEKLKGQYVRVFRRRTRACGDRELFALLREKISEPI